MNVSVDELRARVKSWVEPVSADAPAGGSARFDPRYERATNEVAKLDSPSAGSIDWKLVVDTSGELLRTASKDLLLAAHMAYGLYATGDLDGLLTGIVLLTELVDQYWPGLQPELKRIRGRVNAMTWFVEKSSVSLGNRQIGPSDRDRLDALGAAAQRLAEVVREKFGADAPAMRPLLEAIERLKLSLPVEPVTTPEAPSAAPPPPAPVVSAAPPTPTPAPAVPTFASGVDPAAFLREVGSALASSSGETRRADPSQPTPYRVLRTAIWLHLAAPPPSSGGKTQIPPPPPALRASFDRMAANAKWLELVEEAESSLIQHRLWLDPHRISAQALASLGPSHATARQALVAELASFLRRFGGLVELSFSDGVPLADPQTRAWIDAEVLPATTPKTGVAEPLDPDALASARKLIGEGKIAEAVLALHDRAGGAASAEARFRLRLDLAQLLLETDQPAVARGIFISLDEEMRDRGLDEWNPPLAAACLEAHLQCLRALARSGKNVSDDTVLIYNRLCRLDPVAAMRIGIDRTSG
jgi:type VI secretion system protein VasJ